MVAAIREVGSLQWLPTFPPIVRFLLRLAGVALIDVFALWLTSAIYDDGNWFLAVAILLATIVINIITLVPGLWPLRWMTPALAILILLAVYPILYTGYVAFTNYSEGHRLTKVQAIELLEQRDYLPEGAVNYYWALFQNEAGEYALWLRTEDGSAYYFATIDSPLESIAEADINREDTLYGAPTSYKGFQLLEGGSFFRAMQDQALIDGQFGNADNTIGITGRNQAGDYRQRWVYDKDSDTLTDLQNNIVYKADSKEGNFVAPDGSIAPLGYWVPVGFRNFKNIFESSIIDGPLLRVFSWTMAFAFFSVVTSFWMGLGMALILNRPFPGVRIIRSLFIIPWGMPGMIAILIWRGMLNAELGIIPNTVEDIFGTTPSFLGHPLWAKFSILLVNLWFAFPYFMLICSGTLQSIPSAIYEAAEVDGANTWNKFWKLTLPLLLVSVGPLLIASFIFNFNNYLLIEALTKGQPQIRGTTAPPVGHTDNLMTYTYRFAFSADGTRDYGFASGVAVIIFILVAIMALIQFRLTKRWEEVGENV